MFTKYTKDDGGRAVNCDGNVTAATNKPDNSALTVWF